MFRNKSSPAITIAEKNRKARAIVAVNEGDFFNAIQQISPGPSFSKRGIDRWEGASEIVGIKNLLKKRF
jgi:hypothetical protein